MCLDFIKIDDVLIEAALARVLARHQNAIDRQADQISRTIVAAIHYTVH